MSLFIHKSQALAMFGQDLSVRLAERGAAACGAVGCNLGMKATWPCQDRGVQSGERKGMGGVVTWYWNCDRSRWLEEGREIECPKLQSSVPDDRRIDESSRVGLFARDLCKLVRDRLHGVCNA
jgi:hypothetical protein